MPDIGAIQFDRSLCIGCGLCVRDCVRSALHAAPGECPTLKAEDCFMCGHCIAICPKGAVTLDGEARSEILPYDSAAFDISPQRLFHTIKFRRSVRQFTADPLQPELIAQIIEAGRFMPTGSNKQNVSYIVLQKETARLESAALAECIAEGHPGGQHEWVSRYMPNTELKPGTFFWGANAVILVISSHAVSASVAAAGMELMAHTLGIGAFYCGLFMRAVVNSPALQAELGIKSPDKLVTCLCLGHPAVRYHRTVPRNPAAVTWR